MFSTSICQCYGWNVSFVRLTQNIIKFEKMKIVLSSIISNMPIVGMFIWNSEYNFQCLENQKWIKRHRNKRRESNVCKVEERERECKRIQCIDWLLMRHNQNASTFKTSNKTNHLPLSGISMTMTDEQKPIARCSIFSVRCSSIQFCNGL